MRTQTYRSGAKRPAVSRGRPQRLRPARSAHKPPLRGNLKAALTLIGPAPLDVARQTWSKGLQALKALGAEAVEWNPGILAAAIMSLTEARAGIQQFWESYREGIVGWPTLLAAASEQLLAFKEGRSHLRQAELALYMARRYCERTPVHRAEGKLLSELREPFEKYRVAAMQTTFVGVLRRGGARPDEQWAPEPITATDVTRLKLKNAQGKPVSIALERALYEDVCRVLSAEGVRGIACEIAEEFDPAREKFSLSSIVQDELIRIIASNLSAAKLLGLQDASRFTNPKPTRANGLKKPAIPNQVKRGPNDIPYRRNTSVIISCGRTLGITTTVSLARPLYDKACAAFGKRGVNDILRESADRYDAATATLSRSQTAREALLQALCQHERAGAKASKH